MKRKKAVNLSACSFCSFKFRSVKKISKRIQKCGKEQGPFPQEQIYFLQRLCYFLKNSNEVFPEKQQIWTFKLWAVQETGTVNSCSPYHRTKIVWSIVPVAISSDYLKCKSQISQTFLLPFYCTFLINYVLCILLSLFSKKDLGPYSIKTFSIQTTWGKPFRYIWAFICCSGSYLTFLWKAF